MSATAALVVAFTLPWMLSMRQSSGTLLYPLLGKGYHQSVYGNSLSPYSEVTPSSSAVLIVRHMTDPPSLVLVGLGLLYLLARRWRISGREPTLSLLAAAFLGKIALTLATGGNAVHRYSFPFVMPAVIVLLAELVSCWQASEPAEVRSLCGAAFPAWAVAAFLLGFFWDGSRLMYLDCFRNIAQGLKNVPLVSGSEIDAYEKLQQSVPRGETFLARLDKPFLLDFRRNTVFLMDQPGEASPPPGMPLFHGPEPLASYLTKSIRYVAYSYGDEAGFTRYFSYRLSPYNNLWDRTHAQHTFDVQDNLAELGKTRRRIFDDGKNFVLDLQAELR